MPVLLVALAVGLVLIYTRELVPVAVWGLPLWVVLVMSLVMAAR